MAGVDHTCLVFKNGELMESTGYYNYEKEQWVSVLPFEHNRDGCITKIKALNWDMIDIYDRIKWYRNEYDAIYERAGIKENGIYRLSFYGIIQRLKWIFHVMDRVCYRKEVGTYQNTYISMHIYHDPMKQSYVSFYKDSSDTYVVIGGYGHWENVYTHFMHRGYGDEFEKEMSVEAYHWACDKVLYEIIEALYQADEIKSLEEEDQVLEELRAPFGKFDHYLKEY